jgi:cyclohexanecarboxylate-CoA ligase
LIERRYSNSELASSAYARGVWVRETLADALRKAAEQTPERLALIDAQQRIDCRTLLEKASALAQALLARASPGSVVSFMLPNWH